MLYSLVRPLLFSLEPESAHHITLKGLKLAQQMGWGKSKPLNAAPVRVMGLDFPNPVGLAAGLDKNGQYLDALATLGFGFLEVGTVTPLPQPGNPKPRLFRLPKQEALVNRMGFNNQGVEQLVENIKGARYSGILGINIGKNAVTPIENAIEDYRVSLRKVAPYADYVAVNISSPNTAQLRELLEPSILNEFLQKLLHDRDSLTEVNGKYLPIALKLSPDIEPDALEELAHLFLDHKVDALIVSNTTTTRPGVDFTGQGGLSGRPLKSLALTLLKQLRSTLGDTLPIIATGGIMSAEDAHERLNAGASLVQIYSGLIYKGPNLISDICRRIPPHKDLA